ncbi:GntR family transcriptional regulator [Mycobacterium sp. GA-2829]|uniref:GntR family transcriptional regulator n=1 Tax=Mycobacterium sp. GA-2829 TaxID=1772283 RepID=UPI0007402A80|nr:GntR family transcriptional regulator [Mycobacterium sp. GA-2829]KUI22323.1 GntR family transcriptional regulator [Mycobacterium sp. GA-2829]
MIKNVDSEHVSRADAHYLRVKQDLLTGRFEPGTVLLETTLGKLYGVSRTPMRDALARLAHDRLIERHERGFIVRQRSAEEVAAIYEARIPLEARAAALAAQRRGAVDLERLEHTLTLRREERDPALYPELNGLFHLALRGAARSDVIESTLGHLDDMLTDYRPDNAAPKVAGRGLAEHEEIMTAVRDNDAAAASDLMTAHLERMRDLRIAAHVRRQSRPVSGSADPSAHGR